MPMEYNKSPISLREGKVLIDGVLVLDCVKFTLEFTPEVWSGKQLGERTDSSRWLGGKVTGNITRRRSTPFLKEAIAKYLATGQTPEMTMQGIANDKGSDYFAEYGTDVTTALGCVLTGSLPITALDSAGEIVEDNIAFAAKTVV